MIGKSSEITSILGAYHSMRLTYQTLVDPATNELYLKARLDLKTRHPNDTFIVEEMGEGREVRVCVELSSENEFMSRRDDRLIFYADFESKQFKEVRIVSHDSFDSGLK